MTWCESVDQFLRHVARKTIPRHEVLDGFEFMLKQLLIAADSVRAVHESSYPSCFIRPWGETGKVRVLTSVCRLSKYSDAVQRVDL
jgi:hypothetical protein